MFLKSMRKWLKKFIILIRCEDVVATAAINAQDAQLVLQYASQSTSLSEQQLMAADVNEDGVINATDALMINKFAAKVIDTFEKEE